MVEGGSVVVSSGYRHTCADGVAGAKHGPKIGGIGHPHWGDNQVIPTPVVSVVLLTPWWSSAAVLAPHQPWRLESNLPGELGLISIVSGRL